jgi:hypothetical protein
VLNDRVLRPSRVAINKVQTPAGAAQVSPGQAEQQNQPAREEASQPGTDATETTSASDRNTE